VERNLAYQSSAIVRWLETQGISSLGRQEYTLQPQEYGHLSVVVRIGTCNEKSLPFGRLSLENRSRVMRLLGLAWLGLRRKAAAGLLTGQVLAMQGKAQGLR
jgi:hypothetical protein